MERVHVKEGPGGLTFGVPDGAVKLVQVRGGDAIALAHLCLHRSDLTAAEDCLDAINRAADEITRTALWQAAIVQFLKCFGRSAARSRLDADTIYASHPPEALQNFRFFKNHRDKNVAHDENPFSQCIVVAALNDGKKPKKVEELYGMDCRFWILDEANSRKLKFLIETAAQWVESQYNACADKVSESLEEHTYEELAALPEPQMTIPTAEDAGKRR
jgi:hypothetical protein